MQPRQAVAAPGPNQKCRHRRENQDRFEPFAQDDHERAHKRGGRRYRRTCQTLLSFAQQPDRGIEFRAYEILRLGLLERIAILHHGRFDARAQVMVTAVQAPFGELESLEVGVYRELIRLIRFAGLITLEAFLQRRDRKCDR